MPDELRGQLPLIAEIIHSLEAPLVRVAGYEADDVIGTISARVPHGVHCYIVSSDKDTLQLVTEDVTVVSPNNRANKVFTPELVTYEMGGCLPNRSPPNSKPSWAMLATIYPAFL